MEINPFSSNGNVNLKVTVTLPMRHVAIYQAVKSICDALRDLVLFVQFKKRENTHVGQLF